VRHLEIRGFASDSASSEDSVAGVEKPTQRGRGTGRVSLFSDRRGIPKKVKTMTASPNAVPAIARKLKSSKVSCNPIPLVWIGLGTGATLLLIPP
jgi:hypothetical protein